MAEINLRAIDEKCRRWSNTTEGKRRMRQAMREAVREGRQYTGCGDRVATETDMWTAAAKLINVLHSTAQSYGLPASVMAHFDSLHSSEIHQMPDGTSVIYIYFGDDLHRDSLYSDGYDGVDNIVAVLNNGYHAANYVYGSWDGHSPTGESLFDGRSIDTSAYIRSRKDRDGLAFMQQAVQDFNGNYGADFNVTAVVGDEYTGGVGKGE